MTLYHGSSVIVDKPLLVEHNRFLDFGPGFYTTLNKEQAVKFAKKVMFRNKAPASWVSVYEFDSEKAKNQLKILTFDFPGEDWLDFVCQNRSGKYNGIQYDVVNGPIANDDVLPTIRLYENGFLSQQQAIEALKVQSLYNQFVLLTGKALALLAFQEAIHTAAGGSAHG
jgi:hypothetical protein